MARKDIDPNLLVSKQVMFEPSQHYWLQGKALENKRNGTRNLDSISKIVRQAVIEYKAKSEQAGS
jgi:hypothetical protein